MTAVEPEAWEKRAARLRARVVELLATSSFAKGEGPEGVSPSDVAHALGVRPEVYAQARKVHVGLHRNNKRVPTTLTSVSLPQAVHDAFVEHCAKRSVSHQAFLRTMAHDYLRFPAEPTVATVGALWGGKRGKGRGKGPGEAWARWLVNAQLPRPMQQALTARARGLGVTLSTLMRSLIIEILQNKRPSPPRLVSASFVLASASAYLLPAALVEASQAPS